VLSRKRRDT